MCEWSVVDAGECWSVHVCPCVSSLTPMWDHHRSKTSVLFEYVGTVQYMSDITSISRKKFSFSSLISDFAVYKGFCMHDLHLRVHENTEILRVGVL